MKLSCKRIDFTYTPGEERGVFVRCQKIFLKFIEKTVTNSLLISLVVVEAVHTICFASSEKNRWKKSRTHQMMPRCRMMQQSAPITSNT